MKRCRFSEVSWKVVFGCQERPKSPRKQKLTKIEDLNASEATWKDVGASWKALLDLRGDLGVERGLAVLDAICADDKVLSAVGMVEQLKKIVGAVPTDVLTVLNEGPGAHIRDNAYHYRKQLEGELVRVRHVKDVQWRFITALATGGLAAAISVGNVPSRLYYDLLKEDPVRAGWVALGVVLGLLVCMLSCIAGYAARSCLPCGSASAMRGAVGRPVGSPLRARSIGPAHHAYPADTHVRYAGSQSV